MESAALMVQRADGLYRAGKGRMDVAGNKDCRATSQAQAFLFGWDLNSHQLAHASQPLDLIFAIKDVVVESLLNPLPPGIWLEQAVRNHPVRTGPGVSRAAE